MSDLIGYLSEVEQLNGELTIPKQLGGSTLGTKTITENDTYYAEDDGLDGYSEVTVNVSGGGGTMQSKSVSYTPSASAQTDTVTPDSGYDGLSSVAVSIAAMPTGTEGTPTATKGAVSNHSVAVTPSVTNAAGYIEGGTKTGTAVTVSASELVSGTKQITQNGTGIDVTDYEDVDVAVPNSYSASDEGKVVSNGALVAQTAHTDVTPTTSDQTIDTTLNNSLKVKGDADLVAGNIKKDVEIFGVTGSYEGGGGYTTEQIFSGNYPDGDITFVVPSNQPPYGISGRNGISSLTLDCATNSVDIPTRIVQTSAIPKVHIIQNQTASMPNYCISLTSAVQAILVIRGASTGGFAENALRSCSGLKVLDYTYTGNGNIAKNCFYEDNIFDTLILRGTAIVPLNATSAFSSAAKWKSGGTGGTIYIPKSLYDHLGDGTSLDYKAATNWVTIDGTWHTITWAQIEGSQYENYYADGTAIS